MASTDPVCTRYTAHVRCQEPRQEVIEDLKGMLGATSLSMIPGSNSECVIKDTIEDLQKCFNGNVPKRIIIFCDGVSEGEYQRVLDHRISKQVEGMRMREIFVCVANKRAGC